MINELAPQPIKGVIFDFHDTLVGADGVDRWIDIALCQWAKDGRPRSGLDAGQMTGLRDHLDQIWWHANTIDRTSERDLSPARHREVFHQAVALYPGIEPGLIVALYDVMPDRWRLFDDALPVLRELKARGIRSVVLSNIGLDIRPFLDRVGASDLLDGVVLSFEAGLVKPDPAIFAYALELLDVPGDETLMVGDSPTDDVGGVPRQIRTLILPRTGGRVRGLGTVLSMVGTVS